MAVGYARLLPGSPTIRRSRPSVQEEDTPFVATNGLTEAGTSKTVAAGGMTVHYHDVGEGEPVLFLHSYGPVFRRRTIYAVPRGRPSANTVPRRCIGIALCKW